MKVQLPLKLSYSKALPAKWKLSSTWLILVLVFRLKTKRNYSRPFHRWMGPPHERAVAQVLASLFALIWCNCMADVLVCIARWTKAPHSISRFHYLISRLMKFPTAKKWYYQLMMIPRLLACMSAILIHRGIMLYLLQIHQKPKSAFWNLNPMLS